MMKRNLRRIMITLMLVVSVTLTMGESAVEAATVSSWIASPAIPVGGVSKRSAATRLAGTAKTATAEAAFAQFDASTFGSLPTSYGSVTGRAIFVYLRDLDDKNADDLVAMYSGSFYGRKLVSISTYYDMADGSIESTGDNAAELYIDIVLCESMYDSVNACTGSGLFKFRVGMN